MIFVIFCIALWSVADNSKAQQFYASETIADTVATVEALSTLLQKGDNVEVQFELEYRNAQIVKQLEQSADLPQLWERLLYLQAASTAQPALLEFLQTEVYALAQSRWQADCAEHCANITFLHHNPFVFTALAQLPRAYAYVNTVLPLAAPRAAALALFDMQRALATLYSIDAPLPFFASLALLRRVLIYYGYTAVEIEKSINQHSQRLLRRTQMTQAMLLAFTGLVSWQAGLKKLPKRMLTMLLPLASAYLISKQLFASERHRWQQAQHYSDQMLIALVQTR